MALKGGRVGVHPDDVDLFGRIIKEEIEIHPYKVLATAEANIAYNKQIASLYNAFQALTPGEQLKCRLKVQGNFFATPISIEAGVFCYNLINSSGQLTTHTFILGISETASHYRRLIADTYANMDAQTDTNNMELILL